MRVLKVWDSIDDVEPDDIVRSDTYGELSKGDFVTVEGRGRMRFRFHQHVINRTRNDEYIHLIGASKKNLGRSFTVAPDRLTE